MSLSEKIRPVDPDVVSHVRAAGWPVGFFSSRQADELKDSGKDLI